MVYGVWTSHTATLRVPSLGLRVASLALEVLPSDLRVADGKVRGTPPAKRSEERAGRAREPPACRHGAEAAPWRGHRPADIHTWAD